MKQKLLRLLFLPAVVCTLLAVGSFTTAGIAHAASQQSHVAQSPADEEGTVVRDYDNCDGTQLPNNSTDLWLLTDVSGKNLGDPVCFYLNGTQAYDYFKIYDVSEMWTGAYTVTFNWTDCNGGKHLSNKPPHTNLYASNADGNLKFAGYNVMCEITFIGLSF